MSQPQSYENHARFVPLYHFVLLPIVLICLIIAVIQLFRDPSLGTVFDLLMVIALALTATFARVSPLAAQDRIIRLEMHLLLAQILPDDLRARIHELTPRQLIALRFASDEELPALVRQVLDGKLKSEKKIKQSITNWKADHLRV